MIRLLSTVTMLAILNACGDGQPFFDDATTTETGTGTGTTTGTGTGTGTTTGTGTGTTTGTGTGTTTGNGTTTWASDTLGGTEGPMRNLPIFRFEADKTNGGGYVSDVSYDAESGNFTVDNLGFDGANIYSPVTAGVAEKLNADLFRATDQVKDFLTGKEIEQAIPYRALYEEGTDGTEPMTRYAIVRTGAYNGYGIGGYVYERDLGVTMPASGQAGFNGKYSGIRVFDQRVGIEYTSGDMDMQIDFEDFNANAAIKGEIKNRRIYSESGMIIATGTNQGQIPAEDITWSIQPDSAVIDKNGEISLSLYSRKSADGKVVQGYETGTFNGLLAGDTTKGNGGQIVGIVTLTSEDPRYDDVTVQETGGVILRR
jgi:hypothetical protein